MIPANVQTLELVMVDFIAMEAVFGFKERARFVKGPYALIPLAGPAGEAAPATLAAMDDFLEELKDFITAVHRCGDPATAATLAAAVLAQVAAASRSTPPAASEYEYPEART